MHEMSQFMDQFKQKWSEACKSHGTSMESMILGCKILIITNLTQKYPCIRFEYLNSYVELYL